MIEEPQDSEERMRADIADMRAKLAAIEARPRRAVHSLLRLAIWAFAGFVILTVIGGVMVAIEGPPDPYNDTFAECTARGGDQDTCHQEALDAGIDALARDPEMQRRMRHPHH